MRTRLAVAFSLVLLTAACTEIPAADSTAPRLPATGLEPTVGVAGIVRTTSGDQTGNRVTTGTLDLGVDPIRVELDGEPRWVVGGPAGDGRSVHVVVLGDGSVTAITVEGSAVSTASLDDRDPDTPPIGVFGPDGYRLIAPPAGSSPFTAPAAVGDSIVSMTVDGDVTVTTGRSTISVPLDALGDSRLAVDERDLVAVLSEPTGEYAHGVLGDRVESKSVTIFDAASADVVGVADAPQGTVFETVAPMWADVDGDGDSELLVTASDATAGGRLTVFDEHGEQLAASPAIGRGQRWRNLLGVAPLGESPAIVDVRTPHIGGIVQWFRLDGSSLVRFAAIGEYSSHRLGRRNLDQGVLVDGDGDGELDVVVPSQNQQALAALTLADGEPIEVRVVPLAGRVSSNLSAFTADGGRASLALGLEDGSVLIWP